MITEEEVKAIIEVVDLSKLKEPNSILLIHDSVLGTHANIEILQKYVPKNTLICITDKDHAIEAFSEQEMNDVGWYRK